MSRQRNWREVNPAYSDRIYAYVELPPEKHDLTLRRSDHRFEGPPEKSVRTSNPIRISDVHVVDRNADGVFITGAKMDISASSIEHELVIMLIPKAMYPGEEKDYVFGWRRASQRARSFRSST